MPSAEEDESEFAVKSRQMRRTKRKRNTNTVARNAFFAAEVLRNVSPDMVEKSQKDKKRRRRTASTMAIVVVVVVVVVVLGL